MRIITITRATVILSSATAFAALALAPTAGAATTAESSHVAAVASPLSPADDGFGDYGLPGGYDYHDYGYGDSHHRGSGHDRLH